MQKNKIIYPTFKDAQQLYTSYSTIENGSVLYDTLSKLIDNSYLSSLDSNNIHEIYNKILLKYYPNEICIKSNFINKILIHGKKHVTIFELPIGSSRADLCKINGTSIAYEIKTDLDNFSRLYKQIQDYFEIFDQVYVICSYNNIINITNILPEQCGIYSYTLTQRGSYKFDLIRKSETSTSLNKEKQLNLFRKSEFKCFKQNFTHKQNRAETISDISHCYSTEEVNEIFKSVLKNRYRGSWCFLKQHYNDIYEIDYQWFFKNQIDPIKIYKKSALS
ncbi:MAG: sce7726 family protein [Lachnospiraceae bacterium]|nr:sce7726 family protein [Lachnospiraceae bacterium]